MRLTEVRHKSKRTKLHPFAQAVVVRTLEKAAVTVSGSSSGAALKRIRKDVAAGLHDRHPGVASARSLRRTVKSVGIDDMPPDTGDVLTLLEALAIRTGCARRHDAWQQIGINAHTGAGYTRANRRALTWPIWRTLRDAALGPVAARGGRPPARPAGEGG